MATKEELRIIPSLKILEVFERAKVDFPATHEERDPLFKLINMAAEMTTEALSERVLAADAHAKRRDEETEKLRAVVKKACLNARATEQRSTAAANKATQIAAAQQRRAESLEAQLKAGQFEHEEQQAADAAQSSELTSEDLSVLVGQSA